MPQWDGDRSRGEWLQRSLANEERPELGLVFVEETTKRREAREEALDTSLVERRQSVGQLKHITR